MSSTELDKLRNEHAKGYDLFVGDQDAYYPGARCSQRLSRGHGRCVWPGGSWWRQGPCGSSGASACAGASIELSRSALLCCAPPAGRLTEHWFDKLNPTHLRWEMRRLILQYMAVRMVPT